MIRIVSLMAALAAAPAAAGGLDCMPRGSAQGWLEQEYFEVTVGQGTTYGAGVVVEVWVSRAGTWSITETADDGLTCVVAFGEGWVFIEQPWPDMDEVG